MFSRISQLGKNLTDELSRINDEVTSARTIKQGQLSNSAKRIDPELADRIMGVKTPDLETITKPDAMGASTADLSFSTANDESVEKKKIDVNKTTTDEVKHSDTKIDESKTDCLPAVDNSLNGEGKETGEVSKASEAEPTAAGSTLTRIEPSRKGLPQGMVVPGTGVKYSELPNEII
ncbi:DEKNAAC101700, partial [Brettanomyces naardenensis]